MNDLRQHLKRSARGIYYRTYLQDFGLVSGIGRVSAGHIERLPALNLADEPFRQGEPNLQGTHRAYPKQAVTSGDILPQPHVAPRYYSVKWGTDVGLLQLQGSSLQTSLGVQQRLLA